MRARRAVASADALGRPLRRTKTPRDEGGLGELQIPLVSDMTRKIARDYGVLLEDLGHTLR